MISVSTDAAMQALGEAMAAKLRASDVLCLVGPLGAGKTTLVRGLARGLGVSDRVSSPTFVIARRHIGERVDLLHCDAYRVGSAEEFDELALETANAVTVIEWGSDFVELLADDWLEVTINRGLGSADEGRQVDLRGHGNRWPEAEIVGLAAEIGRTLERAAPDNMGWNCTSMDEVSDDPGD